MRRTAPPIPAQPKPQRLTYLGRFAAISCIRAHAHVRQLWLWRENDRLFAVGVFATLIHGRKADFVTPVVLGESQRNDGSWRFQWTRDGRSFEAQVEMTGDNVTLAFTRPGLATEHIALARRAVFTDQAIELAPRSSPEDWAHWFKVVLMVHFTSGLIPAC